MADCIHHLNLCPDCAGLRVTQLDRLEGVTGISLDGIALGEVTASTSGLCPAPARTRPQRSSRRTPDGTVCLAPCVPTCTTSTTRPR